MRIHELFSKRPELLTDADKSELQALETRFREGLEKLTAESGMTLAAYLVVSDNAIVAQLKLVPVLPEPVEKP